MIRFVCLAGLGLAGCVIDSKVDEIDLDLSERRVIVDTSSWELTEETTMPAVECGGTPKICADQVETWCGADEVCSAACGGQTCEVKVLVALWSTINLAQEETQLAQLEGEPLQTVTIDEVTFAVSENTLNVSSPELTVSVASAGVMTAGGGAQAVGTIPALAPGETVKAQKLEFTADGQALLAGRMREYLTPFNLVVGSTVKLRAGDPIPRGRLVADLEVDAHADTGL